MKTLRSCKLLICPLFVIMMIMVSMITGCDKKREPVLIGFSGCLSGRLSDLGTAGRNGAMMAVEEVNKNGGIKGRTVKLLIRDDQHDKIKAAKVNKELICEGVIAIVGHMTSSMAMATVSIADKEKILLVGPTVSTDRLTGLDDYFIRVIASHREISSHQARYAYNRAKFRKMACAYDLSNSSYTESWYKNFKSQFQKSGGEDVVAVTFSSGKNVSYNDIVDNLLKSEPDGLVFVASSKHTAMICHQLRKRGSRVPVLAGAWAQTQDLLRHGGKAVEGIVFFNFYNQDSTNKKFLEFKNQFKKIFEKDPNFAAACGYDAAKLVLDALKIDDDPVKLKKTILERRVAKGLQGDFELDKYGDAKRKYYRIVVKGGKFVTVE